VKPVQEPPAAAAVATPAGPSAEELALIVAELRAQLCTLTARVGVLEQCLQAPEGASLGAAAMPADEALAVSALPSAPAGAQQAAQSPAQVPAAAPPLTEDELLSIAAAVAAFLGVRARIRQVRLVQSAAWAQVGRATIHASHRVH
jgi:methylmalonyl-CoA carboxyltransferase large subunit